MAYTMEKVYTWFYPTIAVVGAIAQLVEQWCCNPAPGFEGDTLVLFGKALILITRSLGEDLKPSVLWLLTNKHFMIS